MAAVVLPPAEAPELRWQRNKWMRIVCRVCPSPPPHFLSADGPSILQAITGPFVADSRAFNFDRVGPEDHLQRWTSICMSIFRQGLSISPLYRRIKPNSSPFPKLAKRFRKCLEALNWILNLKIKHKDGSSSTIYPLRIPYEPPTKLSQQNPNPNRTLTPTNALQVVMPGRESEDQTVEEAIGLVPAVLAGHNCAVIAVGRPSSGKTYSVSGVDTGALRSPGITSASIYWNSKLQLLCYPHRPAMHYISSLPEEKLSHSW